MEHVTTTTNITADGVRVYPGDAVWEPWPRESRHYEVRTFDGLYFDGIRHDAVNGFETATISECYSTKELADADGKEYEVRQVAELRHTDLDPPSEWKSCCETCRFWSAKYLGSCDGLCRWRPPAGTAPWPTTYKGDWCGEYKVGGM